MLRAAKLLFEKHSRRDLYLQVEGRLQPLLNIKTGQAEQAYIVPRLIIEEPADETVPSLSSVAEHSHDEPARAPGSILDLGDDLLHILNEAPERHYTPVETEEDVHHADTADTRCRRCKQQGQPCVHGVRELDHARPTTCIGCQSLDVECSFDNVQAQSADSALHNADWEGLLDPTNKQVFETFLERFVIAGVRDQAWRDQALATFDLLKTNAHGVLFFSRNGDLHVNM